MITARFFSSSGVIKAFEIFGHSGYAEQGSDIVCAAVSSAVSVVCNTITEVMGEKASVSELGNRITFSAKAPSAAAQAFIKGLYLELSHIMEDYPKNLVTEVIED